MKRQDMVSFIQGIKNNDSNQQKMMTEVLQGGKNDIKRHYAVDTNLYGTDEGVAQREKAQTEYDRKLDLKRKKKKKKKNLSSVEEKKMCEPPSVTKNSNDDSATNSLLGSRDSIKLITIFGSLAVISSLLLGGKRSN